MSRFSLEKHLRIYNDDSGDFTEVRQDRDGLGLLEIVQDTRSVQFTVAEIPLLIKALTDVADSLKKD
jgi:hypothetical protein